MTDSYSYMGIKRGWPMTEFDTLILSRSSWNLTSAHGK